MSWSAAWSIGVGALYPNGEPSGVEAVLPIKVSVPFHLRRDVWAGARWRENE